MFTQENTLVMSFVIILLFYFYCYFIIISYIHDVAQKMSISSDLRYLIIIIWM